MCKVVIVVFIYCCVTSYTKISGIKQLFYFTHNFMHQEFGKDSARWFVFDSRGINCSGKGWRTHFQHLHWDVLCLSVLCSFSHSLSTWHFFLRGFSVWFGLLTAWWSHRVTILIWWIVSKKHKLPDHLSAMPRIDQSSHRYPLPTRWRNRLYLLKGEWGGKITLQKRIWVVRYFCGHLWKIQCALGSLFT